jgi:hypothetical protein
MKSLNDVRAQIQSEGRSPQVGDVWRWQHDPRVAYLVAEISGGSVDGRFVEYATVEYEGPQSIEARYFRDVYTFDAEATAKAKAEMAAANCQAAVDVVLGAALCGPPRAELPEIIPPPPPSEPSVWTRLAKMQDEAFAELAVSLGGRIRGASSSCPRCGGPAYVGLQHVECLRPGGCRTAEERIGPMPAVLETRSGGEPCYFVSGSGLLHPTRSGAIALWREAAIAAERGR